MRHEFAISLFAIASAVVSKSPKNTPTFSMVEDKSIDGSPSIIITFPNGESDTLMLEKYYANEEDMKAESEFCHYNGRLAGDPDATVALTGCLGGAEDVEFTILSGQLEDTMFRWTKEGTVESISEQGPFMKDVRNICDRYTLLLPTNLPNYISFIRNAPLSVRA